uniref:Aborted microspores n=1 Tax=Allium cepa TaxID=4679 RepID=A0A2D2AKQ9_ALLCE|nr:aborted microspores [Allium cepa]
MPRFPRKISTDVDNADFADSMLEGFSNEEEAGKKYKSKNLDAERRRRCKLNTKLLTLRTLVPNITKMSKESTLVDAVDYIQSLKKQIHELKLELTSIPETNKDKQVSSSSSESIAPEFSFQSPGNIDLYPMGRNKFQVNMTCKKIAGNFAKLLEALARYELAITDISFFSFSGFDHIVFSVEAKERKEVSAAELRKMLLVIVGGSEEN